MICEGMSDYREFGLHLRSGACAFSSQYHHGDSFFIFKGPSLDGCTIFAPFSLSHISTISYEHRWDRIGACFCHVIP